jgi:hypothetical protein
VARRAEEIQAEVDRRDSQLAARREDLARQFAEADREHARRLAELQAQRDSYQRQIDDTRCSGCRSQGCAGVGSVRFASSYSRSSPLDRGRHCRPDETSITRPVAERVRHGTASACVPTGSANLRHA